NLVALVAGTSGRRRDRGGVRRARGGRRSPARAPHEPACGSGASPRRARSVDEGRGILATGCGRGASRVVTGTKAAAIGVDGVETGLPSKERSVIELDAGAERGADRFREECGV